MSASTSSTIDMDCSLLSLCSFIELMSTIGWQAITPTMHLSPSGDKYDWVFSNTNELQDALRQLDRRKTFGGIVLWKRSGVESGNFIIDWIYNRIEILWGADCPKDTKWLRTIDCDWIMSEHYGIANMLSAHPSRIEIHIQSP